MSSFNDFNHNCFKDAFLIALADGSTSIFGGTAVFATLGFMAKQLNLPIDAVVQVLEMLEKRSYYLFRVAPDLPSLPTQKQ